MKQKICKGCEALYTPRAPLQVVCSLKCSIEYTRAKRLKKELKAFDDETRQRRNALKTKTDYFNEARRAIQLYVRERDYDQPCISCGRPNDGNHQRHASHYRTVKAAKQISLNLWNINASCAQCNVSDSGNILNYRIGLIDKIGRDKVTWLETNSELAGFSIEYLQRVKRIFNRKARVLKNRRVALDDM